MVFFFCLLGMPRKTLSYQCLKAFWLFFSKYAGKKAGLMCRYSQDRPFCRAQELLLTLLRVLWGENLTCNCAPPPPPTVGVLARALHVLLPATNWQHLAYTHAAAHLFSSPKAKDLYSSWLFALVFMPLQSFFRKLICCFATQSLVPIILL